MYKSPLLSSKDCISFKLRDIGCSGESSLEDIIGYDDIKKTAKDLAQFEVNILILGETGVGKELYASGIHKASSRKEHPFIYCNCSMIPSSLLETELFGYKKGTFTDAKEDRIGKIESAHGGTLFLDEIGNISFEDQAKILRAVEYKNINRIGDNMSRVVDVRYVYATNIDLLRAVKENRFRSDLYHRISAHVLDIPPLRKRINDLTNIIKHYWQIFRTNSHISIDPLSSEEIGLLSRYEYPGNVRELVNILERIFIYSYINKTNHRSPFIKRNISVPGDSNGHRTLKSMIIEYTKLVAESSNSISEATRILGVDRKTVLKYLNMKE